MSVYTFTDADLSELVYELNDSELFNDVLAIVGEPEAEQLVRGYDDNSIAKYGRRSLRLNRPLGSDDTTVEDLVTAQLDRTVEPCAVITLSFIARTPQLLNIVLSIMLSDRITLDSDILGFEQDLVVERIEIAVDISGLIVCSLGAIQRIAC